MPGAWGEGGGGEGTGGGGEGGGGEGRGGGGEGGGGEGPGGGGEGGGGHHGEAPGASMVCTVEGGHDESNDADGSEKIAGPTPVVVSLTQPVSVSVGSMRQMRRALYLRLPVSSTSRYSPSVGA